MATSSEPRAPSAPRRANPPGAGPRPPAPRPRPWTGQPSPTGARTALRPVWSTSAGPRRPDATKSCRPRGEGTGGGDGTGLGGRGTEAGGGGASGRGGGGAGGGALAVSLPGLAPPGGPPCLWGPLHSPASTRHRSCSVPPPPCLSPSGQKAWSRPAEGGARPGPLAPGAPSSPLPRGPAEPRALPTAPGPPSQAVWPRHPAAAEQGVAGGPRTLTDPWAATEAEQAPLTLPGTQPPTED